jgi:hypothetical protein
VNVATNPPGANVFVDDQLVGQTPMVVTLDREKARGNIRIEAAGFQPVVMTRSKQINGWFWANLCFGGVIGIVVDLVTGDVKRFDDSPIAVGLTPAYGPAPAPAPEAAPAPAPAPATGP